MSYFQLLMTFIKMLPPDSQEKLFDLYRKTKSVMNAFDDWVRKVTPDSYEEAVIAGIHEQFANAFLHNAIAIGKRAGAYTHEMMDLALVFAQKLFGIPDWKPDWFTTEYNSLG